MNPNRDVRVVALEEFIPADNVEAMLDVARSLLGMLPQQRTETADDLKRSMVWMRKYIGPTSEYWDWTTFQQPIDQYTDLRVSFIGLGWVVVLTRGFEQGVAGSLVHVEEELAHMLDRITQNIPLGAILRLRAKEWSPETIKAVAEFLKNAGHAVETVRKRPQCISFQGFTISLDDGEFLVSKSGISNLLDLEIKKVLKDVRRWANMDGRFQGADWCAYKRRRLTTVIRQVTQADISPSTADFDFTDEPSGEYKRECIDDYDLVHKRLSDEGGKRKYADVPSCSVVFPAYQFHRGILNPRMVVRTVDTWDAPVIDSISRYYSYLWVNHYTRLWRYLEFEDQFSYTSDVRRIRELSEDSYYSHGRRMRVVDNLRAGIELGNRIDDGGIGAYQPPHDEFLLKAGRDKGLSVGNRLRSMLISSTITSLTEDPLRKAPEVLEHAVNELSRSYENFAQVASLRMQRSLQVLQVVLLVGALAPVLLLVPIPEVVDSWLTFLLGRTGWYAAILHAKQGVTWLRPLDLSLYTLRLVILVVFTMASLMAIRTTKVTRLLRRFFE